MRGELDERDEWPSVGRLRSIVQHPGFPAGRFGKAHSLMPARELLEPRLGDTDRTRPMGNAGRPVIVYPGMESAMVRVHGDHPFARSTTIALGTPDIYITGPVVGARIYPYAKVTWGTDGATHTAYVDFIRGQQITVAGSWVQVAGGNEAAANWPAEMSASIAYGNERGNSRPPTRTGRHAAIGAGANQVFNVPPFGTCCWYMREPAASAVVIDLIDGGVVVGEFPLAANASQLDAIPIPSDVEHVRINATGALNQGRLVFGLAL